jgi:hypothetical protein
MITSMIVPFAIAAVTTQYIALSAISFNPTVAGLRGHNEDG